MYTQKKWFASRKLWVAVLASGVTFGNAYFDLGLDAQQVILAVSPIIAYVLGQSAVDSSVVKAEGEALNTIKRAEADVYREVQYAQLNGADLSQNGSAPVPPVEG